MAKDNSELIDVNSDVKDRVMEVSHIQSLIYVIRGKQVTQIEKLNLYFDN